jgi:hypothetical protein
MLLTKKCPFILSEVVPFPVYHALFAYRAIDPGRRPRDPKVVDVNYVRPRHFPRFLKRIPSRFI